MTRARKKRVRSGRGLGRKSPLKQPVASKVEAKVAKKKINTLRKSGFIGKIKASTVIADAISDAAESAGAGAEGSKKGRQFLEPSELKEFFKYMPPTSFWYSYFFIQYFYGCRLSEPALILDDDIANGRGAPIGHKTIIIRRLKKSKEEEGFRAHTYVADPRVLACIDIAKKWKEKKGVSENPFIFASNRQRESEDVGAERLSQLRNLDGWQAVSRFTAYRMYKQIAKAINLPKSLQHANVLRHTRAVMMLAAGASPETVQYWLGHSSLKLSQRFIGAAEALRGKFEKSGLVEMGLGL